MTKKTLVIAEVGVNHNGDFALAKKLIEQAALTGADVIKFQTALPELVQTPTAPKAKYQEVTTGTSDSALEMSKGFHFPLETFPELKSLVEREGKTFMSTAFDLVSLKYLSELGQTVFKVPSGEITNLPYLRKVAEYAKEVIISTGMSSMDEIQAAVSVMNAGGVALENITVLQCNTAYPTPIEDSNVLAMVTLGQEIGVKFGYSDHTIGPAASLAAVALGATVIEKHITLDCNLIGPDHAASMEPEDFRKMVTLIREIDSSLGTPFKIVTQSELENKQIARRGLYFSRDIQAGEVINTSDLVCLRPENGFSPMDVDEVIGKAIAMKVTKFDPVSLTNFG